MGSITEFLEARIADDEAVARAASESSPTSLDASEDPAGPVWEAEHGMIIGQRDSRGYVVALWDDEGSETLQMHPAASAHIARHDPARVLAECEAKRAILAMFKPEDAEREWDPEAYVAGAVDDYLRALASVYQAHRDYQQEWAA